MSMAVHGTSHGANDVCSQQPKTCMVALQFYVFKKVFSPCYDNDWMAQKLSAIR